MMSLSFMCQREEGIDKCRVACRQGVVVYLFICLLEIGEFLFVRIVE